MGAETRKHFGEVYARGNAKFKEDHKNLAGYYAEFKEEIDAKLNPKPISEPEPEPEEEEEE